MLKSELAALTIPKPARNECNTLGCGLFAIANMYYTASGKKPSSLNLNRKDLRSHLLKCTRKGAMNNFPLVPPVTVYVRPKA